MSGGYRPPSSEPKGTWARAVHRKRRADNISQQRAFELLGAKLGLGPKSRAAYVALDMGRRAPTAAEAAILADWLGGYPTDDPVANPGDATTATPGLADLTAAISRLAEQLDLDRQERQEARREFHDRLARLEMDQGQWARLDERSLENRRRIETMAATLERLAGAALGQQGTGGRSEQNAPRPTGG